MRKGLVHCCHRCDWQHTLLLDGEGMQECFDHCPRCRSPDLLVRRATRLETLAASFTCPGCVAYRKHGKLPLKGLDSRHISGANKAHIISLRQGSNYVRS